MGMSASQARLLSLTARMTDNENSGQDLSYSKMRLADQTEEINTEYLNALKATKLTVLTGFDGSDPTYTDISYKLMTGFNSVACGKQYCVTDNKGRVLVTNKQAQAFESGNGELNKFLAFFGYSKADIDVNKNTTSTTASETVEAEKIAARQKIHEAWDKYLVSIGKGVESEQHSVEYNYTSFSGAAFDGYVTYNNGSGEKALNYEGTTKEQRELYDYAVSLTEAYYGKSNSISNLKNAADQENQPYINYLTNLFYKMLESDYYTEQDESKTIKDDSWFEDALRKGDLQLEYYSTADKKFVSTSISDDTAIQEVEDEREIAIVEQKHQMAMDDIERKDKKIDMELKKLDTEHNALQTEYDSVKSVIDKNVEKTFNIFS